MLNALGTRQDETLYIGNSDEYAYFAKNAGVDFVYLERRAPEFDRKDWAIVTIHSPGELLDDATF